MLYSSKSRYSKAERWLMLSSRRPATGKSSRFHGVARNGSSEKPWRAMLRFDGRNYFGGAFRTEEEAALAWNRLALSIIGPIAEPRLNRVPDSTNPASDPRPQ